MARAGVGTIGVVIVCAVAFTDGTLTVAEALLAAVAILAVLVLASIGK